MKNNFNTICLLAVTSLLVGACSNNTPPTTSGTGTSQLTQGDDFSKHLKIDNPELALKLMITDVKSRKTNDLLEINLQLTSTYEKSLQLQYHFNWFDAQGFVIESRKTPWKPVELHGMQTTTLRGLAPSEAVATFSVYVREVPKKAYEF